MNALPDPAQTRRATVTDLAREAGVSTATVDRVLNDRGGVRPATISRVLQAADRLGYVLTGPLPPAPRRKLRVAFVLPDGANRYLQLFGRTIEHARTELEADGILAEAVRIARFNPQALAERLIQLAPNHDGVAFMALEHPVVREAVTILHARGVAVLTLISDLAHTRRAAFVGMDNRSAGRTAGLLLGRFLGAAAGSGGKVAMFAGSLSYRGHEEREMGFRHILAESFPSLAVIGLREGHDDPETNFRQAEALLHEHPDVIGIYNVGGASEGIARALKARSGPHVTFIGHGLTAETRALLLDGTLDAVIDVPPQMLMRGAARIFRNLSDGRPAMSGVEPAPIGIVLRENLP